MDFDLEKVRNNKNHEETIFCISEQILTALEFRSP